MACFRQLTPPAIGVIRFGGMEDTGESWLNTLSARNLAVVAVIVPAGLFIVLKQLQEPKSVFQAVSIASADSREPAATLAEMARAQADLIHRAHTEMVALTMLGIALLLFLFNRHRTKYVLIASAAASLAACLLNW